MADYNAVYDATSNAMDRAANAAVAYYTDLGYEAMRPSYMLRPSIQIDGNKWCALYGANLQDGVAGFGNSPDEAFRAFDKAWQEKLNAKGDAPQ